MSLFKSFAISASGLTAQRLRMDIISNNIANAQTTKTAQGGPYKRQAPVFTPMGGNKHFSVFLANRMGKDNVSGVKVAAIKEDSTPPRLVYDPNHPDADERGYVAYPNVDIVKEMVDMIGATRAYQANITAINSAKTMAAKALEISR
jgi:flagellar basal-body rod protein FlgC